MYARTINIYIYILKYTSYKIHYPNISLAVIIFEFTPFKSMPAWLSKNVSTIFYYKNKKLEYIRTIEGEETELLKVNITYDVNQNLFEIPEGYVQK